MHAEAKPTCLLVAPIATRSGYGDYARQVAGALIEWDRFDLKIVSTPWGGCPMVDLGAGTRSERELASRLIQGTVRLPPELHVHVGIPNEFRAPGRFNVGITAGIESTLPSAPWIAGLNRMNLNLVPSRFAKEVFVRARFTRAHPNGVREPLAMTTPMEVAFMGADSSIFKKTLDPCAGIDAAIDSLPEAFAFLFVGHWLQGDLGADRKDVGRLIQVFSEAFRNRKAKPALILKTSGPALGESDKQAVMQKINAIRASVAGELPNVFLIYGNLSPTEMNRLYNHPKVKAHISFTHGEGFGRPLLEATLSGKPVLAPDWSGHLDFLPKELAVLLPGSLGHIPPSARNQWLIAQAQWFNVDYGAAARKMQEVYDDYPAFVPNAEKLREQNAAKFTLEAGNRILIDILEKYLRGFTP